MASSYLYEKEIWHTGLGKHKVIKGNSKYLVEQMANSQLKEWEAMWEKKKAIQSRERARLAAAQEKEQKKALAIEATKEAQSALKALDETLFYTLKIDDRVKWESLKSHEKFNKPKPKKPTLYDKPIEPDESSLKYRPRLGLLGYFSKKIKEKRVNSAKELFKADHTLWETQIQQVENDNIFLQVEYKKEVEKWEQEKQAFLKEQEEKNAAIDERKHLYEIKDPNAITDYCNMVLSNSKYPDYFPQDFDLEYNPNNGIVVINYSLPAPNVIPKIKEVKFIQSRNELSEIFVSEAETNKRYDSLLYQICLRTIHELFEADLLNALNAVVFNGWVCSINPSTGKEVNSCVLSVSINKSELSEVDLANVDPKACFKSFKGVGSSKLHSLTAVAPVLNFDKNDSRFISSYEVANTLDETVNLAAMDWEDFEHLIREIFEKEFSVSGGEVKVTQASRDGGVDAVAFDPDPIRGGKIVIQAKRYTNTVGVSAVRDLYGTVMNEGATKGILVTTADYGPDAYEFAKGKPLTLLNGANLLSLLEKHGQKAKIDLKEAKKIINN